jgi:hypothetical protein
MGILAPVIGGIGSFLGTTAGATVAAAGIGLTAYSQIQQGRAENKAAEFNAEMSDNNAAVAAMEAEDAKTRGAEEEKKFRMQTEELKGRQRAAAAASGVMVDEGSALDSLANTAMYSEDDALTLRANTAREAWGHQVQAANYKSSAQLSRMSKSNPYLGAAGGILSGISAIKRR